MSHTFKQQEKKQMNNELKEYLRGIPKEQITVITSPYQIYGPVPTEHCRWVFRDCADIYALKDNLNRINMYNYISPLYILTLPHGRYHLYILIDQRRRIPRFGKSW